ncbi:hypothetical protein H1164_06865 [Thermoactinomyces daqus]|uniref:Uncharacterized protein n=1 Tax=Thermoactinomyces daqus TaxID=1329516 RepID=A0A7W2AGX4_9BACL|nr:Imm26 family immunity protein [Thermoactinomyces daqus]MBA4542622.1 hypothetical protein [Thermoactinomyces daqus]
MGEKKKSKSKSELHLNSAVEGELRTFLQKSFLEAAKLYQSLTGRIPSLEEWERMIALGFQGMEEKVIADLTGYQITEGKLKKKKLTKQAEWRPGDVVAIPLLGKKVYGYGMIVRGGKQDEDLYLEYYSLFSKKKWTLTEFKNKEKTILWTLCTDRAPLATREWKRVGHVAFDEKSYQLPDFFGFDETFFGNSKLYYISKGIANNREARVYGVTREEAEAVKNPDGTQSAEQIEEWLYEAFLGMQQ